MLLCGDSSSGAAGWICVHTCSSVVLFVRMNSTAVQSLIDVQWQGGILSALRGVLKAAYSLQLMSAEAYQQAQSVFASELPAIPLYYRLKVAAARADLCHFDLDPSANPMWNLEAFDMGQGCQQ